MLDLGHAQLDLNNFGRFEKFYLWKIEESDEETDFEHIDEEHDEFEHLKK